MEPNTLALPVSKQKLWTGRILKYLPVLFLFFDSIPKILKIDPVVKATIELGYPESIIPVLGIILFTCTVLYLIPKTSFLGAVLLTGYLGGAVATQVRIESPLFTHILFPVYLGILIWGGLLIGNKLLQKIMFLQSNNE